MPGMAFSSASLAVLISTILALAAGLASVTTPLALSLVLSEVALAGHPSRPES